MLRGYRCIIFAVVGWLALAGQAPSAERVSSPAPAPKEQAQQSTQNGSGKPKSLSVTIVESAEQAKASERGQAESRQHDARDLDAQIRAADAAEEQVFPSWLGAILSFAGTALIIWTLYETRSANALSRREFARARIESRKAYAEARRANEIAQDTAAKQLRPYLYIMGDDDSAVDRPFVRNERLPISFKNYGQTPALNVCIFIASDLVKRPIGDRIVELGQTEGTYGAIAPGAVIRDHINIDTPIDVIASVAAGSVLLLRVRITYELPTGGSDAHDITWMMIGENLTTGRFHQISNFERERKE